jgi:heat shock protein HslJ
MKNSFSVWIFSVLWLVACDEEPASRSVCTFNECDDRRPTLKFIENQVGVLGADNINGNLFYSITELDSNGERRQSYLLCEYRRRPWPTAELTIFGRRYETGTHVVFSSRVMDNCDKPIFNVANEEVFYTRISDIRPRFCQNEFTVDPERTEPLTRQWELVGIEEQGSIRFPPCEAINPWIEFTTEPYHHDSTGTQQTVSGYSTVNEFNGAYTLSNNATLRFFETYTTLAGSTTANMDYEEDFYALLFASNQYEINHNLLTLRDSVRTETLLFQATDE